MKNAREEQLEPPPIILTLQCIFIEVFGFSCIFLTQSKVASVQKVEMLE